MKLFYIILIYSNSEDYDVLAIHLVSTVYNETFSLAKMISHLKRLVITIYKIHTNLLSELF